MLVGPLYSGEDVGVWAPENNVKSLIQQREDYTKTIEGVNTIIAQAKNITKQYEGIDDETRRKLSIMIPDSINEIKLYAELTRIGAQANLPLEAIGLKDKGLGEYTVSLTVKTTYTNFKKFISYYEKSMRLFTLESVFFAPAREENAEVKFNVELTTYYLPKERK